jgi:hypothetical protein
MKEFQNHIKQGWFVRIGFVFFDTRDHRHHHDYFRNPVRKNCI